VCTCRYSLFASVSTLMKEDMADVLVPIVTLMVASVRSTEGITVRTTTTVSSLLHQGGFDFTGDSLFVCFGVLASEG